jgi:hypothetical protein
MGYWKQKRDTNEKDEIKLMDIKWVYLTWSSENSNLMASGIYFFILSACWTIVSLCKNFWLALSMPRINRDTCWVHIAYHFMLSPVIIFCVYGPCVAVNYRLKVSRKAYSWLIHFLEDKNINLLFIR